MSGFFRMESDTWESIRELLPLPLSREHAAMDLRFEADRVRLHEGGRLPDHSELAIRWGWVSSSGRPADKRVRLLKADENAWKDPYRAAPKGQAKGSGGAGEGQAKGRRRAGQERVDADKSENKGSGGAGEGQAKGSGGAGEGPHARSRSPDTDTDTGHTPAVTVPPVRVLVDPGLPIEPSADPAPEWARKAKRPPGVTPLALAAAVGAILKAIQRRDGASATAAKSVLSLWKALNYPALDDFRANLVLVADAAHSCPHKLFAKDIRAEGWADGVDRRHDPSTICRHERWVERLRVAEEWRAVPATPSLRSLSIPEQRARDVISDEPTPIQRKLAEQAAKRAREKP